MKNTYGKTKQPSIAVLLNLFPLIMGLGYIYIGEWARFAIVFSLQLFTIVPMERLGLRAYNNHVLVVIWLIALIDVYRQTKAYNARIANANTKPPEPPNAKS